MTAVSKRLNVFNLIEQNEIMFHLSYIFVADNMFCLVWYKCTVAKLWHNLTNLLMISHVLLGVVLTVYFGVINTAAFNQI